MRLIYSVVHPDGTTAGSWSATSITSALWFVFPGGRSWHSALTGRRTGIKESILSPSLSSSHLKTLSISLYPLRLSSPHSFQLCPSDLFASREEQVMWCGCTRCRLTPHRITWVEVYARSYLYDSVSRFGSESYSLQQNSKIQSWIWIFVFLFRREIL